MLNKYELVEINKLEEVSYNGDVYDIEVEEDHSYNIEGICVHNSLCTTRIKTGIGQPQFSSCMECSFSAHGIVNTDTGAGGHIVSDGGCKTAGDVCKAFGGGADFVMLGGLLSGTDECDGEWVYGTAFEKSKDGKSLSVKNNPEKKFLKAHGMSSKEAQEKYHGGLKRYRSAEGKEVLIPYKGSVGDIIEDILGGISSSCSYLGARKIKDMPKCAIFIKVNRTHNDVYGRSDK